MTDKIRVGIDNIRASALLLILFLSFFALVGFAGQQATPPDMSVVMSIQAAASNGASVVETELQSSKEFPVRDVVLRIGNKDFMRSRPPAMAWTTPTIQLPKARTMRAGSSES